MDARQGGTRRPSESLQPGQSNNHTSSPQFSQQSSSLDPINGASAFNQTAYGSNMQASAGDQFSFPERNAYLNAASQAPSFPQTTISSTEYRTEDIGPGFKRNSVSSQHRPSPTHLNIENSNHQFSSTFSSPYPTPSDSNFMLDPSLQSAGQPQNQSINPADLMGGASQSQDQNGSGQNLMQMDSRPSPHQSPSGQQQSQQHHFYSPNHSRHASLDPSSAGLPSAQPQGEWSGMVPYGHRRAPSEHSDVSSVAAPSPYLKQEHLDSYDQNPSPMLNPQPDPSVYQGALGIERFSISDAQQQRQQQHQQQQHAGVSPGHSPYPSPRMSPNQGLGLAPESQFILGSNDFGRGPGPQIYTPQDQNLTGADMTQASQMPPPEIQVDLAPPSRQMENGRNENDTDALSPPDRGRRNRLRAKSDPMSRPMSPGETSPNLISFDPNQRQRSLSPFDASFPSNARDVSPGSKSSRRSSTSSIPNRDYILDLADPSRTPPGDNSKRVQKHPATFQCTLCPKRFTRAYNLRSHLRTHTDERPFVCTVCGKAFARQHDRKRHEGLHSGEKKFVCKGDLSNSGTWGCGRRFARADALGRHFRSEAGRVCIKPLLDEEAAERQRLFDEQMLGQQGMAPGMVPPQAMDVTGTSFTLPAALLAQYPALQGLQWDQLGAAGPADDGEISARSSFDASSGGDFYDDDEGSGYVSGPGTAYGSAWGASGGPEWASDYEGR